MNCVGKNKSLAWDGSGNLHTAMIGGRCYLHPDDVWSTQRVRAGIVGDILGGSFSGGGSYLPEREASASIANNMLAILIDPDVFGMAEAFGVDMDRYADWVKSSPPASGVDAVQFPGDPERKIARHRQAHGIPLDEGTVAQLSEAARKAAVPLDEMGPLADIQQE